ncbi:hypothetical protein NDU88_003931 [Pleurodeles waltl]|uniref:Uncharacterized protein n=1 Tax=Pleurodeles waltl TaxID=8319 RepID=A0AAV7SHB9_PLEWA|nr:hypothetical protein NDU88_003931 [Pleurodeles waltl]
MKEINFPIALHSLINEEGFCPRNPMSVYRNRDKTGGDERKALLSRDLSEREKNRNRNQLTFDEESGKNSDHHLLGGAAFILAATPKMVACVACCKM